MVRRVAFWGLFVAALGVAALVVGWQVFADGGSTPNPLAASHVAWLDIAVLVFREGLECVLVLSAITASMTGATAHHRRPVAFGAAAGLAATAITWIAAVRIIDDLAENLPALHVQAATGLLAVIVLLVVMNWFFHKVYWTGWIQSRNRQRKKILDNAGVDGRRATLIGLLALGVTSVYREGFEVVLFLQNLRLEYGSGVVLEGAAIGLALTLLVGALTFLAHRKLHYKRMLVLTGVMLGVVLIVMVGESVQEMQLAGWLPTTTVPLAIPGWVGLWLAVFPTVEGLVAQALAAALVLGSYFGAEYLRVRRPRARALAAQRAIKVETTAS